MDVNFAELPWKLGSLRGTRCCHCCALSLVKRSFKCTKELEIAEHFLKGKKLACVSHKKLVAHSWTVEANSHNTLDLSVFEQSAGRGQTFFCCCARV